tara:strand:- start:605 stop:1831 length:1227 start_codon:yes stop_codon:yes gene_type:complete
MTMTKRLNELRQERGEVIHQARQISDKAGEEKRSLSAEERAQFDAAMKKAGELKDDIAAEEMLVEEERSLASSAAPNANRGQENRGGESAEARQMSSFRSFLCGGLSEMTADERRDLQVTDASKGGNIITPQQFVAQLLKDLDNMVHIRKLANVIPGGANGIGVPTLDADVDDFNWTEELATGSEDSAMRFGKRSMEPNPLAKRIKVSNALLSSTGLNAEDIVRQRLVYKLGVTQEKAYLTGDGNKKPLGVFTPSNSGIPTSRDVSAGNTSSAITADNLKRVKYALKQQYRGKAQWLFHRDIITDIALLKGTDNQYIWREGLTEGEPDRLLNLPLAESEYAPSTKTASQYVGILGDFSNYWILDNMQFSLQRLVELYAENNQTGFIGRYQGDGAPALGEAFARVQLAS